MGTDGAGHFVKMIHNGIEYADMQLIADSAGAKGTGGWTVKTGLDLGVPVATIAEAVAARSLSAASVLYSSGTALNGPSAPTSAPVDRDKVIENARQALFTGKILAYVQGYHEIAAGAQEYGWDTKLGEVARIWRAGCIIRARVLDRITEAYEADPELSSLLAAPYFQDQRDFFGSHTYARTDRDGTFHTLWSGDRSEVAL